MCNSVTDVLFLRHIIFNSELSLGVCFEPDEHTVIKTNQIFKMIDEDVMVNHIKHCTYNVQIPKILFSSEFCLRFQFSVVVCCKALLKFLQDFFSLSYLALKPSFEVSQR